ncbi:ABC transporter C member 13 [Coemansia aciculifera]|uniref:ABC transporter C member 13 n=1 Tax=Coemansia aciculifera TaxID=417176 RepID=A0A9W8IMB1_9FUNG|nr:ABC transporter C member 13 [Coemansia aciculifera]
MNATLRANILFGREYDEDYYWKVLSACALTDDLEMWPKSDMTVIGENGMNISGGQRARLALARTVYSRADIYFLDDPLSAVDAIIKRHILDNIILSTGLLGDKLRFVTTNADNILPLCNQITTVDNGRVSVKVQTPQVHTAFEFKSQTMTNNEYVDNTSKELHAAPASDDKIKSNVSDLGTEENKYHDHSKSLVNNGAQMIRLFGVEPYFTNNYIQSAERTTLLAMVRSTYFNLYGLVFTATETALRSMLLYIYIAMSKIGLYTIRAGDVAEFHENCASMGRRIETISSLSTGTFKLLEKINEFRNLAERDAEAPYVIDSCRPSVQWPPNGKIEFRDFSMKYHADLGFALKNVNLTINPGEKIGIVGRTGAGKSSLAKVLFRLIHENTSGSILIDGQDISEFGVGDYRPLLGMIPQESTMLDGSIRRNLDPLNQFDVENMWASLIKCNMAKFVSPYRSSNANRNKELDDNSKEGRMKKQWQDAGWLKRILLFILKKVPKPVDTWQCSPPCGLNKSAGRSFGSASSGQQQLFGLCRVIMRKRKIIVLDEATANVDLETDKSVQELIRKEFSDCTVLTIAHRLETIMNSDRIIVMDKGTIAEIGTPQELLAKDGMFAQLVKTSDFGQ